MDQAKQGAFLQEGQRGCLIELLTGEKAPVFKHEHHGSVMNKLRWKLENTIRVALWDAGGHDAFWSISYDGDALLPDVIHRVVDVAFAMLEDHAIKPRDRVYVRHNNRVVDTTLGDCLALDIRTFRATNVPSGPENDAIQSAPEFAPSNYRHSNYRHIARPRPSKRLVDARDSPKRRALEARRASRQRGA